MTSTSIIRDVAMKGAGYYSRATTGAKDVIDNATPMVLDAADALPIPEDGRPITVADMGCADGGHVDGNDRQGGAGPAPARAPGHPIQMIYTDLPRNDFSQLFQNVHGLTDLESSLVDIPDVYWFRQRHLVSQEHIPAGEPASRLFGDGLALYQRETLHHTRPRPYGRRERRRCAEAYEAQGARDWEAMLLQRTRELVPGGHLALFNFGIDEEGRYLGHTGGVSMFDTYNELWRDLADRGTIAPDEYRNTNFAQCYRTVDQFCAPLIDRENPVYRAGLRLKHVETRVVRCPFERDFADRGDADRFAVEYIPTLRSWSEHTFVAGLSPARPAAEKQAIVDRFYDSYEDRVRQSPEGHAMDYVHIYLVCEKV